MEAGSGATFTILFVVGAEHIFQNASFVGIWVKFSITIMKPFKLFEAFQLLLESVVLIFSWSDVRLRYDIGYLFEHRHWANEFDRGMTFFTEYKRGTSIAVFQELRFDFDSGSRKNVVETIHISDK